MNKEQAATKGGNLTPSITAYSKPPFLPYPHGTLLEAASFGKAVFLYTPLNHAFLTGNRDYLFGKAVFLSTITCSSKQEKIPSTSRLSILGVNRLTTGTTTSPRIMAIAPALIGDAM